MSQQIGDPPATEHTAGAASRRHRTGRIIAFSALIAAVAIMLALTLAPSAGQLPFTSGADEARSTPAPSVAPATPTPAATPTPTATEPVVGGWYSGASGLGVAGGAFERWLGQPVTVAATWADQDDFAQRTLPALRDEYADWNGTIDIAVGGTVLGSGENYAAAARGAYDQRWKAAAKVLADRRRNATGPTFVRPFHEMNGSWYDNWVVTKSNSADFKKAWARYVGILRAAMPSVYISWSPNYGDHTGLPVQSWYPGDDVVDCVAPDYYDDGASRARVDIAAWNAEADDKDDVGNPAGPESWRQFALAHGKPVCFPEWGLKPEGDGTDHPVWIAAVNAWMAAHANTATWPLGEPIPAEAAGKVLYSAYFNVRHQGKAGFTIHGSSANPKSSAAFRKLTWGNQPSR